MAEGGGPIGSLYHFFPGGKQQLGVEALTRSGERYGRQIDVIFDRHQTTAAGTAEWAPTRTAILMVEPAGVVLVGH